MVYGGEKKSRSITSMIDGTAWKESPLVMAKWCPVWQNELRIDLNPSVST